MKEITLGTLFDGIGGFPYAALFYGIRPVWASEVLPTAISVTKRHIPEMVHVGDITKLDGRKLPPVDIITFGSPCQGLSISGRRLGLADERSGLFSEAIRIIREMQEVTHGQYPQIAIWENVPGALSSAGGCDFAAVLQAFTETPVPMPYSGRWANAGRRRVFLVADFRGKCAGQILFVPKSLRGYFESGGTPRQALTSFAASSAGGTVPQDRYLSDTEVYCIVGNIIGRQPHNGGNGAGYQSDISYTLTGADRHAVVAPLVILNDQGGASMSVERSNISPTLRSQTHGNLPIIAAMSQSPPAMVSAGFRYKAGSAAGSIGYQEELAPTLMAYQPCGALVAQPERKYIVRRLTPMECERLQGFPDGWTAYDFEHGIISDSKRYEMLGNSVAVPCVAYIMQGIYQVLSERSV